MEAEKIKAPEPATSEKTIRFKNAETASIIFNLQVKQVDFLVDCPSFELTSKETVVPRRNLDEKSL